MRSHTVDANLILQSFADAIVAVLAMHICNAKTEAAHNGVAGAVGSGLVADCGSQSSLNAVGTYLSLIKSDTGRTPLDIECDTINTP